MRGMIWVLRSLVGGVVLVLLGYGLLFAVTPAAIRQPKAAHEHLRLQIVNGGQAISFVGDEYQTAFDKDVCSAALTKEPIHFHDKLDQFVHLHWAGMTGGLLLKHYGWDFIGGLPDTLGYRFNQGLVPQRVAIHGPALPRPVAGARFYVYVGDQNRFEQRRWDKFLHQDLKTFLSDTAADRLAWWQQLVPAAWAHGQEVHSTSHEATDAAHQQELLRINNVLDNVVIFAQKQKPTDEEVKQRFAQLIALPESSCGG